MNDEAEIYLCPRRGWVIRSPITVPDSVLLKMCEHAIVTYTRAIAKWPDSPKKRALSLALPALAKVKVTQEIRKDLPEQPPNPRPTA